MKAFCIVVLLCVAACCRASRPLTLMQILEGAQAKSNVWALIVAGSNTWDNYRHQVGQPTPPMSNNKALTRPYF